MTLRYLIQKEFIQIRRNTFLPKLILVFPVVIMCVMPWVMSMEVKNIRVDVVDNDRSTTSQKMVHSIEASRYFIFGGQKPTYKFPLYLRLGDGRRFRLEFDCKHCQMNVWKGEI
jgi:ABC-2 type transport system permease protein